MGVHHASITIVCTVNAIMLRLAPQCCTSTRNYTSAGITGEHVPLHVLMSGSSVKRFWHEHTSLVMLVAKSMTLTHSWSHTLLDEQFLSGLTKKSQKIMQVK